jgi:1-deoxy-D-xylulose-5-phosphate reductoisomerase
MQTVSILGATGSIGDSTLDVLARHADRFQIHALVAGTRSDLMLARVAQFRPKFAVMTDLVAAQELSRKIKAAGLATEVLGGMQAACDLAAQSDVVMAAIVGAAGLSPTLAAARAGKQVLLANKEALVMAGQLFVDTCFASGATVLPIDSEHNAIFQSLLPLATVDPESVEPEAGRRRPLVPASMAGVSHLVLTASGGPFRRFSLEQMRAVTVEQACAHPNWSMGRKISVDSATLMNKGLELIEACWLFGLAPSEINIVVHPQSVIHSLVQYRDGSMLAQLGQPDMRTPIAHCLGWPQRIQSGVAALDLIAQKQFDFEAPDEARFACLRLAREAWHFGASGPCVLNAANEVSVSHFLAGRIGFLDIARVNERVLARLGASPAATTIDDVLALDQEVRIMAHEAVETIKL